MGISSSKSVPFDPRADIPLLSGKVILVTGGNAGLGKQSIIELARHEPSEIWLTARDSRKGEAARRDVQSQVPGAVIRVLELDLSSLDSVSAAAQAFLSSASRLDILLLNAGLGGSPPGLTNDGYEIYFGTNHLGHALLTKLLMPLLLQTAEQQKADNEAKKDFHAEKTPDVRVVVLTSIMMSWAPPGGIQFNKLNTPLGEIGTSFTLYGQSKLANTLFARYLAKDYPQLTVAAVHPGVVNTGIADKTAQHNTWARFLLPAASPFMLTVEEGVKNQLWASTSKDVISGEFYTPVGVLGNATKLASDDALAGRLREWTEAELEKYHAKTFVLEHNESKHP
ncbi:short-chain dehydrogenase/reductase [Diaporthe sp. PMI_573]|nr:short-chain dehydrogenase/reductase [Diaporthaceae sp. PMI_573]